MTGYKGDIRIYHRTGGTGCPGMLELNSDEIDGEGNALAELARTGHRGRKGSPYPTSPIEEEGKEAAFPIRHAWRIGNAE